MINLFLILGITLILILSNYTALIYGIRLGKAMQRDIPPSPIQPAVEAVKKAYRAVKSKTHKSYYQKKAPKQDDGTNSLWQ
jgi:hypothetical protein